MSGLLHSLRRYPSSSPAHAASSLAWWSHSTLSNLGVILGLFEALYTARYMYCLRSSDHLFVGLPMRLLSAILARGYGSHVNASNIHESPMHVATFRAHFHFRLRCKLIQSWMSNFLIRLSASCVARWIHSDHGSNSVSASI